MTTNLSRQDRDMLLGVALEEVKRMNKIITDLMQELAEIYRQRDDAVLELGNLRYRKRKS